MSRTFKVGDIVNANSNGFELTEKPVKEILGNYIRVCTHLFTPNELTLVTSVEIERGAETYKDQFTPWKPGYLVTGTEATRGDTGKEQSLRSDVNRVIWKIKEQQT